MNYQTRIEVPVRERDERLFDADEFMRMVECGAFEDMKVELVGGRLERMAPADGGHGYNHGDVFYRLRRAYDGCPVWMALELAIRIDDLEVRGADVTVVRDSAPKEGRVDVDDVLLVVEIAKTTLGRDLGDKPVSYGRAGIPEYWVVDLPGRVTHVFTGPEAGGYAIRRDIPFGEVIQPPGAGATVVID